MRLNAGEVHKQFDALLTRVQPTDRVIKLFQHMVFTNWDEVIAQTKQDADNLDQRIHTFKEEIKSIRKAKDEGLYTLKQAKEEAEDGRGWRSGEHRAG